jgi:hypothetical protein
MTAPVSGGRLQRLTPGQESLLAVVCDQWLRADLLAAVTPAAVHRARGGGVDARLNEGDNHPRHRHDPAPP